MALRANWIVVVCVLAALESTVRPKSTDDAAAPAISVTPDGSGAATPVANDFAGAAGTSTPTPPTPAAPAADTNAGPILSGDTAGTNIVNTNLAMADYFINVQQPEKAEPLLVALLAGNIPESLQKTALLKLATTVRFENDLPRAQTIYTQYTQKWPGDPKVPEILLRQGQMFRDMGLNDLALGKFYSVMTSALALKDDQFAYYQSLVLQTQVEIAETHYFMGQFADAADFYQRLIQGADPQLNRVLVQYHLIRSLAIIGRNDQAVAQAQDFTTRFPDSDEVPEVRYYLAQSLKALGRNAEALQQVLLCLQEQKSRTAKNPELWSYWQQRVGNEIGNELYHEGNYIKSLEVYMNLAELDPAPRWQIPVNYQLGMTYEKLLQPEKAMETYKAIVAREPDLGTNNTPALKAIFDMARWRINFIQWQTNADAASHFISMSVTPANNATNQLSTEQPAMNPLTTEFTGAMVQELQNYAALCDEIFNLTVRESLALSSPEDYQPTEFNEKRNELLPRMDVVMAQLRHRRIFWQQISPSERERCEQVKPLFQNIQNQLMKILTLDRENQQAMLRRGLVPVRHLPAAPVRTANFVANVYQRNAPVPA